MLRIAPLALLATLLMLISVAPVHANQAACPDLNGDGAVNVADVTIEASYLGMTVPPAPPQTDMNKDGRVDDADLAYFYPPLIPEPAWITSCQTSPIGPAGAVGGLAQLTGLAQEGGRGGFTLLVAPSALAVVLGLLGVRLALARRRA